MIATLPPTTDLFSASLSASSYSYVLMVLGRTLMKMRAYGEALPVWETLSKQMPDDSHAYLQLARCCRSLKIRDRGISAAQTASCLDPQLQEAAELADFLRGLAA